MKRCYLYLFLICCSILPAMAAVVEKEKTDTLMCEIAEKEKLPISHNGSLVLFKTGKEKFQDLFSAVRQARESIHMEYFNFRNDSVSDALFSLLRSKAKEGVEVRILFDGFGNASNNRPLRKRHLKVLRKAGIEIYEFSPLRFPYIKNIFPRDHRKIVVIDGLVGYMGGMNVADYYIKGKPEFGVWRDLHSRVEGYVVDRLQRTFLHVWNATTHQEVSGPQYYSGGRRVADYFKLKEDTSAYKGHKDMLLIYRDNKGGRKALRRTFKHLIDSSRKEIVIINPYFSLARPIRKALYDALERGVKIKIMVSNKCDIPITPNVVDHNVHRLMKAGAEIYYFKPGFHHSKMMVVDGKYSFFGSGNLDCRSLYFDYENNLLLSDPATAAALKRIFEHDSKRSCFKLTEKMWKEDFSSRRKRSAWFWQWVVPFI